jgi:disulfide bond formation protein DsbB
MLKFFNHYSRKRGAWYLMILSALTLELGALYFQHAMLLQPCVNCIYERCALFGILIASMLGAIAPESPLLRYPAILLWIYSAWEGTRIAWKHSMLQLYPSPLATCDFFVNFPTWLPLDRWIPAVFNASGDCFTPTWKFLSLGMPQWLTGIFSVYLVLGILVLVSQFTSSERRLFRH